MAQEAGGCRGRYSPCVVAVGGAASARQDNSQSAKYRASDQGGLVHPEERVATLASSEGPTYYRQVGVATRDEAGGSNPLRVLWYTPTEQQKELEATTLERVA